MRPQTPRKLLIDTDTASDDAVALIMALRSPDVHVLAITTVAGNVDIEQATQNALYTVSFAVPPFPSSSEQPHRWPAHSKMLSGSTGATDSAITAINRLRAPPRRALP